jgi:ABC-type bacteriocin/lantibiotic exporter with double-glycine peptidase domain
MSLLTVALPIIVLVLYSLDALLSDYIFNAVKKVRVESLSMIFSQRLRDILKMDKSEMLTKTISATSDLGEFYYYTLSNVAWFITSAVVGMFFLLKIQPVIAIIMFLLSILQVAIVVFRKNVTTEIAKRARELEMQGNKKFSDVIEYYSFFKMTSYESIRTDTFINWRKMLIKNATDFIRNFLITDSFIFLLSLSRNAILYILAMKYYMNRTMLIGDVVAINSYTAYLIPVWAGIQEWFSDWYRARVSKQYVDTVLMIDTEEKSGKRVSTKPLEEIEVKDLCFKYDQDEHQKDLLQNVNLRVRVGEPLFVTGPSGSGKSTLINILSGIENEYTGSVFYNGIELKEIDQNWLYNNLVSVIQENDLLPMSIRENLLFSGCHAKDSELFKLLGDLQIKKRVENLPGKLDWDVSEEMQVLSDGERRRLSVARALLSDKKVIILDEPTASLDHENQQIVAREIYKYAHDRILIIVTHDIIYEENANILVLGGNEK